MNHRTVFIDFETKPIEPRPHYPPKPVGVAILDGSKKEYFGWGHPTGNNATKEQARSRLMEYWRNPEVELCFHNAKFDLDIAREHFKLQLPSWRRIHDTLFLIYLDDPRAPSLSLKPSAERLLRMKPTERDAVREWLVEHKIVKKSDKNWGAHISDVPGGLVGEYAIGDVVRTKKLFDFLTKSIAKRNMTEAYERERRLLPILLENEKAGIRLDTLRLKNDIERYGQAMEKCDGWIFKRLRSKPFDIDSDEQLADALDKRKLVKEWVMTKKGKRSTSKKNIKIEDEQLASALVYRNLLATYLRTFMIPWNATAQETGGFVFADWNQVRGENDMGTRTGRMSSKLQTIPKPAVDKHGKELLTVKLDGIKLPPLPRVRSYVIGDSPKHVVGSADYSQQELRALGHFENGPLLEAYLKTPRMDMHDHARSLINDMLNASFERKPIKNLAFGLLYGMGIPKTAAQMGVDEDTARQVKRAYLSIFPGLKDLIDDLTIRAKNGLPIRTWGGREYYCEPPREIDGRIRSFEYKMLNVLIQGSSADCTKEAMIRYDERKKSSRFLAQVHDQILISAPAKEAKRELCILRDAMESVEFDVKMLTDISFGPNWADLKELS